MKVSLNWIKEFTDVQLSVDELVDKIGAQLGAVEEVINLGEKYKGIIVAEVVSCAKHPNADKLKVCKIDDNGAVKGVKRDENGHIEIVCGAPNVHEKMLVAWLPPGTVVPSTFDKDPLTLEAREIRGVISNGMLASQRELALGDSHEGILELDDGVQTGDLFAEAYKLNDYVVDIENKMFTHRPDCFGMLGVAREVAGITQKQFISPEWYVKGGNIEGQSDDQVKSLGVAVEIPDLCPRYMAIVMSGVKIAPSPVWLQTYLSRVGIRPINNIVDMTNYIMMLTGQPLHAFDFDKIAVNGRADIVVRKPRPGEKMTLLDGKTIEPRPEAVLICDSEKPLALGGVMGGNNSEIDDNTTRIIIECANFNMYNIRKTAMEHGIFTDSVTRFTKGQSPLQCAPVLQKAIQVVQEVNPGAVSIGNVIDSNFANQSNQAVEVSADFINSRLGLGLTPEEVANLLSNVEFDVSTNGSALKITAPFWRTDIEIPEDIVEEVGRLYGYDKLPQELPKRDLAPAPEDKVIELKSAIRETLSRGGANEILTYSFVHANLLDKTRQDKELAYKLSNALSPELQYYRLSLTPSLLEKVHPNIKSGYLQFAIFEINKIHMKGTMDEVESGLPKEDTHVALVFAADDKTAASNYSGAAYYQAKKYLTRLSIAADVAYMPLADFDFQDDAWGQQMTAPYEPNRSAVIVKDGLAWGVVGEFKKSVQTALKLPAFTAGFEVGIDILNSLQASYIPLPRFPKVEQDISLKLPVDITYGQLYEFLESKINELKPEKTLVSLQPLDIFQRENEPQHKQLAFRLVIAAYDRTLTADVVNTLLNEAALAARDKFSAERL